MGRPQVNVTVDTNVLMCVIVKDDEIRALLAFSAYIV